ncbi:MAG: M17 family peptidase N-terminal domain-containing protein [Myxococcota bacterium]
MEIIFKALKKQKIVKDSCSLIICFYFEDERPLRRLAGIIDWKVDCFLSRLIKEKRLYGSEGEIILFASEERFGSTPILICGLGKKRFFSLSTIKDVADLLVGRIEKMNITNFGFALPDFSDTHIGWLDGFNMFIERFSRCENIERIYLFEEKEKELLIRGNLNDSFRRRFYFSSEEEIR